MLLPIHIAAGGLAILLGAVALSVKKGGNDVLLCRHRTDHGTTRLALILAAAGDARLMRAGVLRGAPRLKRHLWRMCFAMFIAAGSFFSIRERVAKILPDPFTTGAMRALPILLLFGAMFYWLWKLRGRGKIRSDAEPRRPAARMVLTGDTSSLSVACRHQ
jgi:hypothetical protein